MTDISRLLRRMAAQPPHVADWSRRQFIANAARFGLTAAAAAAMTRHLAFAPAFAAEPANLPKITSIPDKLKGSGTVRVCSYGGALQDAQRAAYFKPFEELSGIKVIEAEGPDTAKVKAMVDTKNVEYDVTEEDGSAVLDLAAKGDYWEPIDYSLFDVDNIDAAFRSKYYCDMLPYAQIYAYRRDAFGGKMPKDNKDLWDTATFPGPRALQSGSGGLQPDLEIAEMATGTPRDKVYPIDLDLAFGSLGKLKPSVTKWWTAGAMPAQMLNDNEVVMATAWNGRINAIQQTGAPVDIVWQDQLLRNDCWAVIKDAPNKENAQKFTAFITLPASQARLSMLITYGFVNNKAAALIPAERLKILPTSPEIKPKLLNYDVEWWAKNTDVVLDRWNKFLLG
ncbi:MAG TPA: ABC transporter substrate-binding protein [Acetobacteraceae bacterium]|nr:ABC transporter substrate-binding protein [Acetobacteraceae bacterium]